MFNAGSTIKENPAVPLSDPEESIGEREGKAAGEAATKAAWDRDDAVDVPGPGAPEMDRIEGILGEGQVSQEAGPTYPSIGVDRCSKGGRYRDSRRACFGGYLEEGERPNDRLPSVFTRQE